MKVLFKIREFAWMVADEIADWFKQDRSDDWRQRD